MKRWNGKPLVAALVLGLSLGVAQAREEAMWEPSRVSVEGRPGVTETSLRVALIKAGARRNWTVSSDKPGELVLKQNKAGKHEAEVRVSYDAKGYQLSYANSYNLNANPEQRRIHPTYNMWLRNLSGDIESELTLLSLK